MRIYTLKVVIKEGGDEFWEELKGTGTDIILQSVKDVLWDAGFQDDNTTVILTHYEEVKDRTYES